MYDETVYIGVAVQEDVTVQTDVIVQIGVAVQEDVTVQAGVIVFTGVTVATRVGVYDTEQVIYADSDSIAEYDDIGVTDTHVLARGVFVTVYDACVTEGEYELYGVLV